MEARLWRRQRCFGVRLQQHLDEAIGRAEVAVDLEGRVLFHTADVEEIAPCAETEEHEDVFVARIAIAEPRHAVDDPGTRPAGGTTAGGEALVENKTRRARELGCSLQA